ncbi:MAG: hypothetical protein ACAI35_25825 [Candidatus Methylacidiphilales bacterium]|nr:hypothetical protein [Candidatus Methylacidiphilales bacterium]
MFISCSYTTPINTIETGEDHFRWQDGELYQFVDGAWNHISATRKLWGNFHMIPLSGTTDTEIEPTLPGMPPPVKSCYAEVSLKRPESGTFNTDIKVSADHRFVLTNAEEYTAHFRITLKVEDNRGYYFKHIFTESVTPNTKRRGNLYFVHFLDYEEMEFGDIQFRAKTEIADAGIDVATDGCSFTIIPAAGE